MVTSIVLPAPLASRLVSGLGDDGYIAVLAGVWSDEKLLVVGSMQGFKVDATAESLYNAIPGGVHIVGVACTTPSAMLPTIKHLIAATTPHHARLVAISPQGSSTLHAHTLVNGALVASGACVTAPTATVQQQLGRTWFACTATHHLDVLGDAWSAPVGRLANAVNTTSEIVGIVQVDGSHQPLQAARGGSLSAPTPVHLFAAASAAEGSQVGAAPTLTALPLKGGPARVRQVPCYLHALAACTPDDKPAAIAEALANSMRRQVSMLARLPTAASAALTLYFQPPGWAVPMAMMQPTARGQDGTSSEDEGGEMLTAMRRQWHALLGIPPTRPLLRVANALPLTPPLPGSRLRTVHEGLPPSGVAGGTLHLVDGVYDYFHYKQDRMDDSGWGCAYRSLQTLCSWFQRQGYTASAPPSHRDIQTTLVKIGDKPVDFVGSKQWIGAIELGFVLDALLGVTSKVITASSGDEMPDKARALAAHFDTQGTPVMIGGGVLAYTLLGVDWNADTGEVAFLILDPHYTGADSLEAIHSGVCAWDWASVCARAVSTGKWVAWKRYGEDAAAGGPLFVKGSFYNMLCPQRPDIV